MAETPPSVEARLSEIATIPDVRERLDAIDQLRAATVREFRDRMDIAKRDTIREARNSGMTLERIGEILGVSPQRVHQIANYQTPERKTP